MRRRHSRSMPQAAGPLAQDANPSHATVPTPGSGPISLRKDVIYPASGVGGSYRSALSLRRALFGRRAPKYSPKILPVEHVRRSVSLYALVRHTAWLCHGACVGLMVDQARGRRVTFGSMGLFRGSTRINVLRSGGPRIHERLGYIGKATDVLAPGNRPLLVSTALLSSWNCPARSTHQVVIHAQL